MVMVPRRTIVAIDIGTTKICVLVAHVIDAQTFEIIGIGRAPSDGLRKGVVVDVAKTVQSIKAAVKEAELVSGVAIESVGVGISGGHISSVNSHGVIAIKHGQVKEYDIAAALNSARAIPIDEGQHILHILPQYFVIDGRERVHNPLGMHGTRLEVYAHIILGSISSVQNLVKCCEAAGVAVSDIILEQLASADAVLTPDERHLGVAMLDIGGGTSDLALYQNGNIRHTYVLPVAGSHFTNDLAIGLQTSLKEAERIKKEYGCAHSIFVSETEMVEVGLAQANQSMIIPRSDIARILQARTCEILVLVKQEIASRHLQPFMATGLVLTGGGSLLHGIQEVARQLFDVPVRIGHPLITAAVPQLLDSPIYATGYGLLIHMLNKNAQVRMDALSGPLIGRIFLRMKSWVSDFF